MNNIRIERLTEDNFNQYSLDDFIRHQVVTECWRNVDGEWKLLPISFVEEWSVEKCREEAFAIANNLHGNMIDYGAFGGKQLIGYITVGTELIGVDNQYIQLVTFQVSEPYRGRGVGRKLFEKACETAIEYGAKKLYISAHSSKESQATYKALGCEYAGEIISWIAEEEPFDVQLEYDLYHEKEKTKLETERLWMYPISDEELRQLIENESDADMKQAYSEMLKGCIDNPENRIWSTVWFMELKKYPGSIVGDFSFKGLGADGMIEIGYGLRKGYCKKGYMTEAVRAVSNWALTKLEISKVEAEADTNNIASINVLRRAGFVPTGEIGEEGPRFIFLQK